MRVSTRAKSNMLHHKVESKQRQRKLPYTIVNNFRRTTIPSLEHRFFLFHSCCALVAFFAFLIWLNLVYIFSCGCSKTTTTAKMTHHFRSCRSFFLIIFLRFAIPPFHIITVVVSLFVLQFSSLVRNFFAFACILIESLLRNILCSSARRLRYDATFQWCSLVAGIFCLMIATHTGTKTTFRFSFPSLTKEIFILSTFIYNGT